MGYGSPPNRSQRKPVPVVCSVCGAMVLRHLCRLAKNSKTFCSIECRVKAMVGAKQSEETRGKRSAALSGENAPTWKGGVSRQYKRGYKSEQYKNWRYAIFTRDNYTCQDCNTRGYLTAHHIKSFADYPKLRYEVSNGVTLCERCHSKRDHYFAKFHPLAMGGD